jgi:hypothetical protein
MKISANNESDKDPLILENIEIYVKSVAGDKDLEELALLKAKLSCIKDIIETSYSIGDYVSKYEAYNQQVKSANLLDSITAVMIPEFKEFIASKFPQKLSEEKVAKKK